MICISTTVRFLNDYLLTLYSSITLTIDANNRMETINLMIFKRKKIFFDASSFPLDLLYEPRWQPDVTVSSIMWKQNPDKVRQSVTSYISVSIRNINLNVSIWNNSDVDLSLDWKLLKNLLMFSIRIDSQLR